MLQIWLMEGRSSASCQALAWFVHPLFAANSLRRRNRRRSHLRTETPYIGPVAA